MNTNIIFILLVLTTFGCAENPEATQLPNIEEVKNSPSKVAELTDQFLISESEKGFSGAVMSLLKIARSSICSGM